MDRPFVNLESSNTVHEFIEALKNSLHIFTGLNGLAGILLDGGLSRGYGDFLSEIDVVIYLREKEFLEYKNGACPFALGITVIDGYLYDIKLMNFDEEKNKEYDSVALWDLSYAFILYDPDNLVEDFINQKLLKPIDISSAVSLMWSAYWFYKLAGDIWIHRRDVLQGHFVFNNVIKPLLSALFIANNEYIPHEKWLVHMARSLAWKPDNWETLLTGAMKTGSFSVQSLIDRQQCLEKLWNSINKKICELSGFRSELDITQKKTFESLKKLISKSEYTLDEWQSIESLEALNFEPIHSIFVRVGDIIILDKNALLNLGPDTLYEWMYKIVSEARKGL